jgi:hypothetical protein
MNKEDIWVASIPVPVTDVADADANDEFNSMAAGKELAQWNIYSPLWASAGIRADADGSRSLKLKDADPYDFAMAERVFPAAKKMTAEFAITPGQADHGRLEIEFQDTRNLPAVRLSFGPDSGFTAKAGARIKKMLTYQAGVTYKIRVTLNTDTRMYTVNINGKDVLTQLFFAPVERIAHVVFRTGEARHFPTAESPAEAETDMPGAGIKVPEAEFTIHYLKTSKS